ncbi:MAG: hypothetical protein ACI9DG_001064 [Oleispira sp.]|jgi:uncharacterized protein with NRDE domain
MCLITFQWQPDADQRLILSANRDEFLHRPAQPLHPWPDAAGIYAGKDLSQGGSWLGVHKNGRFAALTNHRDMRSQEPKNPISRGNLVVDFLASNVSTLEYLAILEENSKLYAGYNLLVADQYELGYYSNKSAEPARILAPGLYGLSNGLLDTPWPKVESAKRSLTTWLNKHPNDQASLCHLLSSTHIAEDHLLPDTGIGAEMERILSCEKIITPNYGTRCSTGLTIGNTSLCIEEITWLENGQEDSYQRHIIQV